MTAITSSVAISDASEWLRDRLALITANARRIKYMDGATPNLQVITQLSQPARPGSRDDRSCDRCAHYCGPGENLMVLAVTPEPWLTVIGGLCVPCAALEGLRVE